MSAQPRTDYPPDMLAAEHIEVEIRDRTFRFDHIRAEDFALHERRSRDDRLKILRDNADVIKDDKIKQQALTMMSALNLEDAFDSMGRVENMAWMIDQCWRRAHPNQLQEKASISKFLDIGEVRRVFREIAIASGLIDPRPQAGDVPAEVIKLAIEKFRELLLTSDIGPSPGQESGARSSESTQESLQKDSGN